MVLNDILVHKRLVIKTAKRNLPLEKLKTIVSKLKRERFRLTKVLSRDNTLNLICEIKKASPSRGILRKTFLPLQISKQFERSGAAAISILTEDKYFQGNPEILKLVRSQTKLPVLRKDFIIEPYQIYESVALGADATLLIVSILDNKRLKQLLTLAKQLGHDVLVEVHTRAELKRALKFGAKLIGINNRNLKTLKTDLKCAEKLIPHIPAGTIAIVESGIKRRKEIKRFQSLGINNFFIGNVLMESRNIETKIRELKGT